MIAATTNGHRQDSVNAYLGVPAPKGKQVSVRAIGDDAEFMRQVLGVQATAAGVPVHHRNSLSYSPVWCAVQTISGDIAKLPVSLYEELPDGSRRKATEHPAHYLVSGAANPYMAAFRFWRRELVHLLIWNRSFSLIERDENRNPVALWPLLPDRTRFFPDRQAPFYRTELDGRLYRIDWADVLDLQGIQVDDEHPEICDLVLQARDTWSVGIAAKGFGARFFSNGANVGGIFTVPPEFTQDAVDGFTEEIKLNAAGLDNAFKFMVLEDGAKFQPTMADPEKSQMHETSRESVRDVARYYSCPPHKLMEESNVSYSSLEQENGSYLDSCLSPHLNEVTSQCWMLLLSEQQKRTGRFYFEHDTSRLMYVDQLTQFQLGQIGVTSGLINANEFRARLNMNPRPGGDVYHHSNNMTPEGSSDA